MKVETVPVSSLVLDPANVRKHSPKNLEAIKGSLARFGQQKPIVVTEAGVVVAGNGTLEAARSLGWQTIDVVRSGLGGTDLTAYAVADNRTGELAEWDAGALSETLRSLQELDFDLASIGFDEDDLAAMIAQPEPTEGLTDADEVPEDVETRCKPGDLWVLGEHRLLCGDSTNVQHVERLMGGAKADMVFTDPPYGVSYDGGIQFTAQGVKKGQRERLANDDSAEIYSQTVPLMAAFCDGPIYVWFAGAEARQLYQAIHDAGGTIHAMLVWVKNGGYGALNAVYKQRHEPCLFWKASGTLRWDGPTTENTIWEIQKDGRNEYHPTQKPVALAERAIGNHKATIVLDLFLGSGSTLIACEKTGRRCFGMEIDPKYCDVILSRWEAFTGKQAALSDQSEQQ